jgi:hypothetical protein
MIAGAWLERVTETGWFWPVWFTLMLGGLFAVFYVSWAIWAFLAMWAFVMTVVGMWLGIARMGWIVAGMVLGTLARMFWR